MVLWNLCLNRSFLRSVRVSLHGGSAETMVAAITSNWLRSNSQGKSSLVCSRMLGLTSADFQQIRVGEGDTVVEPKTFSQIVDSSQCVLPAETSAQSRWAADALASELPPQGDFASLGLGGYSPVGLIQSSLEYLHVHAHLPWWAAIIASTFVLRVVVFPIAIRAQANAAKLNNIRPEMEKITGKIRQYNQAGNTALAAQQTAKMFALYQKHDCHPFKMFIMPAVQVPLFLSFFISIRRMAAVPVESMKSGGLLWFTDLTVPDPYYVLPVLACLSFMAIIELGGEAGVSNPQTEKLKTFFRGISILLIPLTAKLPAGLFMYWLTASGISIGQILLLRIPKIRALLGIPKLTKHPSVQLEKGGFVATLKENYHSAVLVDQAKKNQTNSKKAYEKLRKVTHPNLYNNPPHKRMSG